MASRLLPAALHLVVLATGLVAGFAAYPGEGPSCSPEQPPVWPLRFKALQRRTPTGNESECATAGVCSTVVTYYDWERQANLIILRPDGADAGDATWDLELGNHKNFYYQPGPRKCKFVHYPVGVLGRDWLRGANYTGKRVINGKTVYGWTKLDFIDYFADVTDCTPVRWVFHAMKGMFDTVQFTADEAVPDTKYFEPPEYCPNRTSGDVLGQALIM